jgi:transposase
MMSDLFWLTAEQMARLRPYFPESHGRERVDDRRVLSGIIFVNRNGLRWRDAPREYVPAKTLYNRWKRWSDKGIFIRMMEGLATPRAADRKAIMIDATYLKAHRRAASLGEKRRPGTPDRTDERRHEHQAARRDRCEWSSDQLLYDRRTGQ